MLILHQAILIPQMKHNLICRMQLCDNGLCVNDESKHMLPEATMYDNAIVIPARCFDLNSGVAVTSGESCVETDNAIGT